MAISTPDVYIADACSAAFIGHTEYARCHGDNIQLKAQQLHSLAEFEQFFGGPPPLMISAQLDEQNRLDSYTIRNNYFLYDSVRLYFLNGGKQCFVVSVGGYDQAVVAGDDTHSLSAGLKALTSCDTANLLLIPDAVVIANSESFHDMQQATLAFCAKQDNWFAILDLQEDPDHTRQNHPSAIEYAVQTIGNQHLAHSAIYTPWLKSDFSFPIRFRDLKVSQSGSPLSIQSLDQSDEVAALFDELDKTIDNAKRIESSINRRKMGETTLTQRYHTLLISYLAQPVSSDNNPPLRALLSFLKGLAEDINNWICNCAINEVVGGDLNQIIRQTIIPEIATKGLPALIQLHSQAIDAGMVDAPVVGYKEMFCLASCNGNASPWQAVNDTELVVTISANPAENEVILNAIFNHFDEAISVVIELNSQFESDTQTALLAQSLPLQQLFSELQCSRYVPPSGAIAGIYMRSKLNRDIYKASTNVEIRGINGLSEHIARDEVSSLPCNNPDNILINTIRRIAENE